MPHLLAAITAHGYGHLAQSAVVINALRRQLPELELTIYTRAPHHLLRARIDGDFTLLDEAPDIGLPMHDALTVDVDAAAEAYREFHAHWQADVAAEAQRLRTLSPDLVFANVPYRILAAARLAHIPSVALCSLNWADIYRHFCGAMTGAEEIVGEITAAYHDADLFLRPAPSMPMPVLHNTRTIGPIARLGRRHRAELEARTGASPHDRFVLASLGGIPMRLDARRWPSLPGLTWIMPADVDVEGRDDMIAFEALDLSFVDVLASVDVLLTKPGYGSFAEAACNGVPVLYVPRVDWPEEPYLVRWLGQHGRCRAISQAQLERGDFVEALQLILAPDAPRPIMATGAEEAARHLREYLYAPTDRPS